MLGSGKDSCKKPTLWQIAALMPGKCHVIGRLRDSSVDACLGSHACQITRHSIYVAQTVAQRRVMTAKSAMLGRFGGRFWKVCGFYTNPYRSPSTRNLDLRTKRLWKVNQK